MVPCITLFFQDKFVKAIGWLTCLRFCETPEFFILHLQKFCHKTVRVVRQVTYIAAPICMWDLAPAQEGELAAGRFEGWQSAMSLIPSYA